MYIYSYIVVIHNDTYIYNYILYKWIKLDINVYANVPEWLHWAVKRCTSWKRSVDRANSRWSSTAPHGSSLPEIGHGISSIDYLVTTFNFISLEVSPKTYLRPNKSKKNSRSIQNSKSRISSVVPPHLPHSQAECQSQRRLGRCTGDDDAVDHPGSGSGTRKSGPFSCARAGTL